MLCGQSQLIVKVNKQQLFLFNQDSHFESLRTPKIRKFVTVRMRPHPVAHPQQPRVRRGGGGGGGGANPQHPLVFPPPPPPPPSPPDNDQLFSLDNTEKKFANLSGDQFPLNFNFEK